MTNVFARSFIPASAVPCHGKDVEVLLGLKRERTRSDHKAATEAALIALTVTTIEPS
jgi:hypothetical protein